MTGVRALPERPSYSALQQHYEHQLEMARPVSTGLVEVPPIPEGYALHQFRPGDEIRYEDLFHLAFEDSDRFSEIREHQPNVCKNVEPTHEIYSRLASNCPIRQRSGQKSSKGTPILPRGEGARGRFGGVSRIVEYRVYAKID
jgi:hypothetical protein